MSNITFGNEYLHELETEVPASRKCVERMRMDLYHYKPHEKSMEMGYLALLVAEIPMWLSYIIDKSEIDFATFKHYQPKTVEELVKHLDENVESAKKSLANVTNEALNELFYLKRNGEVLFSSPKKENVMQTLNHWVHHRGQFTVYLRLNNIDVPSIYGPSADERIF